MASTEIKLITLFVAEDGEAVYSQVQGVFFFFWLTVYSSDHQILTAKFRFKLKKAEKTTRPVRDNLTQIPYEYAVEVMNRFKGLELLNSMPEGLWMEAHNTYSRQ